MNGTDKNLTPCPLKVVKILKRLIRSLGVIRYRTIPFIKSVHAIVPLFVCAHVTPSKYCRCNSGGEVKLDKVNGRKRKKEESNIEEAVVVWLEISYDNTYNR